MRDFGLLGSETSLDRRGEGVLSLALSLLDGRVVDCVLASAFVLVLDEPGLGKRSAFPGLIVECHRLPFLADASTARGAVCLITWSASCMVSCRLLNGELDNDVVELRSDC